MKLIRSLPVAVAVIAVAGGPARAVDRLIGSPDAAPSWVDEEGSLHEDWGAMGLRLHRPSGGRQVHQTYEVAPVPTVVTTSSAESVTLTTTAYRAPVFPRGVDVLTAKLHNSADREVSASLRVELPEGAGIGEATVTVKRRPAVALPKEPAPLRTERPWGCTGGVVPMVGWAKPNRECDPAFRNISAGMGGVPIVYRFTVPAGAKRTVVLGLCESHWTEPTQRPLGLHVEGCEEAAIDPVGAWGQHVPHCLRFDASDADGDGRLEIAVSPHPDARDRNTILNVIWVFSPNVHVELNEVLRGSMSAVAQYYVDVGGENDQLLYETEPLTYELQLGPGADRELTFLVACAGGSAPDLATVAWTPRTLRRAAESVWADWYARGARVTLPEPDATQWHTALAHIMMSRAQSDAFFLALSQPGGPGQYSHADAACITAALDYAGHHADAEAMLRLYWEKPVPKPFVDLAQADDGRWPDPASDPCAQGLALQALARHALLAGDALWARRAWPAVEAGALWITSVGVQAFPSTDAKQAAAVGLLGAAHMADLVGLVEGERLRAKARELDPGARWGWSDPPGTRTGAAAAAVRLIRFRNRLLGRSEADLLVLGGFQGLEPDGLDLSAEALPTELGPVSLAWRIGRDEAHVTLELPRGVRTARAVEILSPTVRGQRPHAVQVDGRGIRLGAGGNLRISASPGLHEVAFVYP